MSFFYGSSAGPLSFARWNACFIKFFKVFAFMQLRDPRLLLPHEEKLIKADMQHSTSNHTYPLYTCLRKFINPSVNQVQVQIPIT